MADRITDKLQTATTVAKFIELGVLGDDLTPEAGKTVLNSTKPNFVMLDTLFDAEAAAAGEDNERVYWTELNMPTFMSRLISNMTTMMDAMTAMTADYNAYFTYQDNIPAAESYNDTYTAYEGNVTYSSANTYAESIAAYMAQYAGNPLVSYTAWVAVQ